MREEPTIQNITVTGEVTLAYHDDYYPPEYVDLYPSIKIVDGELALDGTPTRYPGYEFGTGKGQTRIEQSGYIHLVGNDRQGNAINKFIYHEPTQSHIECYLYAEGHDCYWEWEWKKEPEIVVNDFFSVRSRRASAEIEGLSLSVPLTTTANDNSSDDNFEEGTRELSVSVDANNTSITGANIIGLVHKEVTAESDITMGGAFSQTVEIEFYDQSITDLASGFTVTLKADTRDSQTSEDVCLGTFYISETQKNNKITTVKAFDKMAFLTDDYSPTVGITFPTTCAVILNDIATKRGFTVDSSVVLPVENLITGVATGTSERTMIGYIAGLMGTNAKFNKDGKLTFVWYSSATTIGKELYFLNGIEDKETETIGALVSGTSENPHHIGNGRAISFTNPYMTASRMTAIFSEKITLQGFTYNIAKIEYRGNPCYECGDILTFQLSANDSIVVPVMNHTLTYNGALKGTIESKGKSDAQTNISVGDASISEIKRELLAVEALVSSMNDTIKGNNNGKFEILTDANGVSRGWTVWNAAKNAGWIMTEGGLGYFTGSAILPQSVAFDMNGNINASYINAGTLSGCNINLGNGKFVYNSSTNALTMQGVQLHWADLDVTPVSQSYNVTCDTASNVADKVVTIAGFPAPADLKVGTVVTVKFTNANTAALPRLGIRSSAEGSYDYKYIVYGNTFAQSGSWAASDSINLYFDGTYWAFSDSASMNKVQSAASAASQAMNVAQAANTRLGEWTQVGTTYIDGTKIASGTVIADTIRANTTISNAFTCQDLTVSGGTINMLTSTATESKIALQYDDGGSTYFVQMSPTQIFQNTVTSSLEISPNRFYYGYDDGLNSGSVQYSGSWLTITGYVTCTGAMYVNNDQVVTFADLSSITNRLNAV